MQGQDKGLIKLSGRALISYVIEAIRVQAGPLLINAGRNMDGYRQFGYPVINDQFDGFEGPLAGIASCMEAADTELIVCVPCDSPFLADDLVARLYRDMLQAQADICMAHDGRRPQPVFALIKTGLLGSLQAFLARGERKTDKWYAENRLATSDFSDRPGTFMNINTPDDILTASRRVDQGQ